MNINTIWTVSYAWEALELNNLDDACYAFDIAVAGGIVFG